MTTELIIMLFVLAIASFVYSAIIAPSLLLHLRFRLFEVRDQVRESMHTDSSSVSAEQLTLLQSSINNALNIISTIDIWTLAYMETQLKANALLRKTVKKRIAILDTCRSKEFQELRSKITRCVRYAFLTNVGTWFFYLVPIVLAVAGIGKIRRMVLDLSCISESELNRASPDLTPV